MHRTSGWCVAATGSHPAPDSGHRRAALRSLIHGLAHVPTSRLTATPCIVPVIALIRPAPPWASCRRPGARRGGLPSCSAWRFSHAPDGDGSWVRLVVSPEASAAHMAVTNGPTRGPSGCRRPGARWPVVGDACTASGDDRSVLDSRRRLLFVLAIPTAQKAPLPARPLAGPGVGRLTHGVPPAPTARPPLPVVPERVSRPRRPPQGAARSGRRPLSGGRRVRAGRRRTASAERFPASAGVSASMASRRVV